MRSSSSIATGTLAGFPNPPAIGVMARAPVPGHCKTRLAASLGAASAADLCRTMLLDTLARIHAATHHVRHVRHVRLVIMAAPENDGVARLRALAPEPWEVIAQEGEDLGARLKNAFLVLGVESDAVALVDADSPTAPWEDTATMLADLHGPRRAAMGPCEDGGYWLIAMTTEQRELGILDDIAWSTPAVAAQTRDRCNALGVSLEELATAYDIDEPRDIERLHADLIAHPEHAPQTADLLRSLGLGLGLGLGRLPDAGVPPT